MAARVRDVALDAANGDAGEIALHAEKGDRHFQHLLRAADPLLAESAAPRVLDEVGCANS
jgi:hypothetical protein